MVWIPHRRRNLDSGERRRFPLREVCGVARRYTNSWTGLWYLTKHLRISGFLSTSYRSNRFQIDVLQGGRTMAPGSVGSDWAINQRTWSCRLHQARHDLWLCKSRNLWVGDVWICSGCGNIAATMAQVSDRCERSVF